MSTCCAQNQDAIVSSKYTQVQALGMACLNVQTGLLIDGSLSAQGRHT